MTIHNLIVDDAADSDVVVLTGSAVRLMRPVVLEAPKAAAFLSSIPADHRLTTIEQLLEYGTAGAAALETSTHIVMLESKVAELASRFSQDLSVQLKTAEDDAASVTQKLLENHKQALQERLAPLTDTNAKDGLPATLVDLLDQANRDALHRISVMLSEGDDGALTKAVRQITEQVKETGLAITNQLAAREALITRSNLRGRRFEDVLAPRLPLLVRQVGWSERCATVEGDKARNAGDYLVTLANVATEHLAIVIEAKSQQDKVSLNEIRKQLKLARANRGAASGIFVAESASILPNGIGFGQATEYDFYVAFNPLEADETLLTCALYMAKVAALATLTTNGECVDLSAANREVHLLRTLMDQFSKIENCHSKVEREITNARNAAADLKSEILTGLRRLDAVLSPA